MFIHWVGVYLTKDTLRALWRKLNALISGDNNFLRQLNWRGRKGRLVLGAGWLVGPCTFTGSVSEKCLPVCDLLSEKGVVMWIKCGK